jgi:hypothetical protein
LLFNPSWRYKPSDPFNASIDNLIDWLRTKPADGTYDYTDNFDCPLAQFLSDNGVNNPHVTAVDWSGIVAKKAWRDMLVWEKVWSTLFRSVSHSLPLHFNDIASGYTMRPTYEHYSDSWTYRDSWTYGNALERALAYRSWHPVHRSRMMAQGADALPAMLACVP